EIDACQQQNKDPDRTYKPYHLNGSMLQLTFFKIGIQMPVAHGMQQDLGLILQMVLHVVETPDGVQFSILNAGGNLFECLAWSKLDVNRKEVILPALSCNPGGVH